MTVVALTAFVTVKQKDGTVEHKFQNGKHTAVDGHSFLSFIYQGAAMNRSGDNLEASIILANNPLSMSYVKDFVIDLSKEDEHTFSWSKFVVERLHQQHQ